MLPHVPPDLAPEGYPHIIPPVTTAGPGVGALSPLMLLAEVTTPSGSATRHFHFIGSLPTQSPWVMFLLALQETLLLAAS